MANKIRGEQIKDDSLTGADIDESTLVIDGSTLDISELEDADNDTKVEVEQSPDEDKIRFSTAGTERLMINSDGGMAFGDGSSSGAGGTWNFYNFQGGGVRVTAHNFYADNDRGLLWGDSSVSVKGNANAGVESLTVRANYNAYIHVDGVNDAVGIGTTTPKTGLDTHHSPVSLADNTGGGECVTFGAGTTTAGKLYYLNGDSPPIWAEIDASAVATGADQMVGIALGTSSADGILIRGFFDATTYLSSFSAGKAVYMSETAASMTTTAPTSAGAIVRIVGYCTDTANVIYFNPSNTWIEL